MPRMRLHTRKNRRRRISFSMRCQAPQRFRYARLRNNALRLDGKQRFPIGRLMDKRFFKPVEGHERIWGNIARGKALKIAAEYSRAKTLKNEGKAQKSRKLYRFLHKVRQKRRKIRGTKHKLPGGSRARACYIRRSIGRTQIHRARKIFRQRLDKIHHRKRLSNIRRDPANRAHKPQRLQGG